MEWFGLDYILSILLGGALLALIIAGLLSMIQSATRSSWLRIAVSGGVGTAALGVYVVFVLLGLFGSFVTLIWLLFCAGYALFALRRETHERSLYRFTRNGPFHAYGVQLEGKGAQLVFSTDGLDRQRDMDDGQVLDLISGLLEDRFQLASNRVTISDVDPAAHYDKQFLVAQHTTTLKTTISTIFHVTQHYTSEHLVWWIMLRGKVRPGDAVVFVLSAPLTIFDWWIRWARGAHSVRARIAAMIDFTYDQFDINSWLDIFQNQFFAALLDALEAVGIDVSAYRKNPINFVQSNYVSNILGSGNVIGAIAQGTANTTTGSVGLPAGVPVTHSAPSVPADSEAADMHVLESIDEPQDIKSK